MAQLSSQNPRFAGSQHAEGAHTGLFKYTRRQNLCLGIRLAPLLCRHNSVQLTCVPAAQGRDPSMWEYTPSHGNTFLFHINIGLGSPHGKTQCKNGHRCSWVQTGALK